MSAPERGPPALRGRRSTACQLATNPRSKEIPAVRICRAWMLERITRAQAERKAQLEEALG